jgi:chromosome segregation ATPase
MNEDQLDLLLRTSGHVSPQTESALREKLAPVLEARRVLSTIDRKIADRNHEIETITNDQKRLRDNLTALKSTPEERDLTRRYTATLSGQEDRLATLHKEIDTLQLHQKEAQANLENLVQNIQLDQTI